MISPETSISRKMPFLEEIILQNNSFFVYFRCIVVLNPFNFLLTKNYWESKLRQKQVKKDKYHITQELYKERLIKTVEIYSF